MQTGRMNAQQVLEQAMRLYNELGSAPVPGMAASASGPSDGLTYYENLNRL